MAVIILGDLDASAIASANHAAIRQRIASGAGILLLGGYHSFDAGGYGRSSLEKVFPVELSKGRSQRPFDSPIDPAFQTVRPTRIKVLVQHPITTLALSQKTHVYGVELHTAAHDQPIGKPRVEPGVRNIVGKRKQ